MDERSLFPASIVDEITHCVDKGHPGLVLNYAWILTLEGEVSTEISRKALDRTLRYYPKSRCVLTDRYPSYMRWFRHCWRLTECEGGDILREIGEPNPYSTVEEAIRYYTDNHAALSIDLSFHIPLKVLLIRQPGRAFLFFIMHHAAADGLGGFFFIQQFIQHYEDILHGREAANEPVANLDDISLPDIRLGWSDLSPHNLRPFVRNFFLTFRQPALNAFPGKSKGITGKLVTTVRHLPPQHLVRIRSTAKQYGSTVNDYLLATMFGTLKKWCREWTTPSDRIYINVPMSFRAPGDRTLSNVLSGAFISLKPDHITGREAMLPLIRKEMTALADSNVARTIIRFSAVLKPITIGMRINLLRHTASGYAPTVVLSNMGVLSPNPSHTDEEGFHCMGNARIRGIYGMPAVAGWPMLLLYTYNNRMIFNLGTLDSYFPPETAGRFIEAFLGDLQEGL